ncbi:hypothetical protein AB6A40_005488 [Gnathostoma spinigerum]|uniref:Uncharacterized protein n=1 Tax=Gnathostoma spinigerum TaxID=75299 RepID=A0ABD6EFK7_9BILA
MCTRLSPCTTLPTSLRGTLPNISTLTCPSPNTYASLAEQRLATLGSFGGHHGGASSLNTLLTTNTKPEHLAVDSISSSSSCTITTALDSTTSCSSPIDSTNFSGLTYQTNQNLSNSGGQQASVESSHLTAASLRLPPVGTTMSTRLSRLPDLCTLPSFDLLLPLNIVSLGSQRTIPATSNFALNTKNAIVHSPASDICPSTASFRRDSAPGRLFSVSAADSFVNAKQRRYSDFSISRLLKKTPITNKRCYSSFDSRPLISSTKGVFQEERTNNGRKQRTIYGASQTRILERAFEEQQYMVGTGESQPCNVHVCKSRIIFLLVL